MPALPDVPNVLRIDFEFTIGLDNAGKCRKFIGYTGTAPTNAQLVTVANSILADFDTHLAPQMNNQNSLNVVKVTDLTSSSAGVGESTSAASVGQLTCTDNPGDLAVLESQLIARRYRGGHSRIYWPLGQTSDLNDEQHWKSTFISDVQSRMDLFNDALIALTWTGATIANIVSVSFYNGFHVVTGSTGRARNVNIPRVTPLVDIIISHVVRDGLASIRKRLLRLA